MRRFHLHHNWLRPERLFITVIVALLTLLLLSCAWWQTSRSAKRKVNEQIAQVSNAIGMPIKIEHWYLGFFTAHFEGLTLGADAVVVADRVSASLNLNPFAGTLGDLDAVTVHRAKLKWPINRITDELQRLEASHLSQAQGDDSNPQQLIQKLFQALPTQRLWLRSGGMTLVDDAGTPLVNVRGLKVLIDKKPQRLLFRVDSFKMPNGLGDRDLQGRLQLVQSGSYRFFLKKKLRQGLKTNAWSIAGGFNQDLTKANLSAQVRRLPPFLREFAAPVLGDKQRLNATVKLNASRQPTKNAWNFVTRIKSDATHIKMPLIASEAIGPVRFEASAEGFWHIDEHLLGIESASINIPTPKASESKASHPIQLTLRGSGRFPATSLTDISLDKAAFQGQLRLLTTSCQNMLDAAPAGLLPKLQGFKLAGEMGGTLDFSFDLTRHDRIDFETNHELYGCKVISAPYTYSNEHLRGSFTLLRDNVNGLDPVEVKVNPNSSQFTPLSHVARTAAPAFVTSEDAGFFTHKGIDTSALENAARKNLSERRVAVGGSTITMQTVKNLFLGHERTISRKLQELFLATHLESVLNKNRILEIYVNIIEFGPGIYGITRAADHFFGKDPQDLTLLESAYLASLLPNPKQRYRYFCEGHLTPAFKESVYGLLRRMRALGRIGYERYTHAMTQGLTFNARTRANSPQCGKLYASGDVDDSKS